MHVAERRQKRATEVTEATEQRVPQNPILCVLCGIGFLMAVAYFNPRVSVFICGFSISGSAPSAASRVVVFFSVISVSSVAFHPGEVDAPS